MGMDQRHRAIAYESQTSVIPAFVGMTGSFSGRGRLLLHEQSP